MMSFICILFKDFIKKYNFLIFIIEIIEKFEKEINSLLENVLR